MNDETPAEHSPPTSDPEPRTKKVSEMSDAERRVYNREAKRQSRERARQKDASNTPTASEWWKEFPITHSSFERELVAYADQFEQKVKSELQIEIPHTHRSIRCDRCATDACLNQVASTLLGLNRGWVRDVQDPFGQMVAGRYFPDALGATIVEAAHRYELEKSETFKTAYRELLRILDKKYRGEQTEHTLAIQAELDGTYTLPPITPAAQKPEQATQPPVPTDAQIRAEGGW